MLYRGYHLEQKQMMVGWQVTITNDDTFVRHSAVSKRQEMAMTEAHTYIDQLLAHISAPKGIGNMRIPTALELTPEEWKSLRDIVAQGFTPTQQIVARHRTRLMELDLVRCGMGGLIATPAGRIVARL